MSTLASQDPESTAPLFRRVRVYEAVGFAAMILILATDDSFSLLHPGSVPFWELVEIIAAVGVGLLTLVMTNRLFGRIRLLEGLVSICMHCKRIKTPEAWVSVEHYVSARSDATFSHGLCPDCYVQRYGGDPAAIRKG